MDRKFCINCKHYSGSLASPVGMCAHGATIDLVTGRTEVESPITCKEAREYGRSCGPDGKLFQQRGTD